MKLGCAFAMRILSSHAGRAWLSPAVRANVSRTTRTSSYYPPTLSPVVMRAFDLSLMIRGSVGPCTLHTRTHTQSTLGQRWVYLPSPLECYPIHHRELISSIWLRFQLASPHPLREKIHTPIHSFHVLLRGRRFRLAPNLFLRWDWNVATQPMICSSYCWVYGTVPGHV